jgi:hypothetical protein
MDLQEELKYFSEVCIFGLPKTGKTFGVLLFGNIWQERDSSIRTSIFGSRKSRQKGFAFYGKMPDLDTREIASRWGQHQHLLEHMLWIVDEAQEETEKCRQLRILFKSNKLEQLGHRLLFVGWSGSDALLRLPTIKTSLSAALIKLALQTLDPPLAVPSDDILTRLVSSGTIGLEQILWASKRDRSLLERPEDELTREYIKEWFRPPLDDETSRTLAVQLARCRFLRVPYPWTPRDRSSLLMFLERGVASEAGSDGVRLLSDELARALLRTHIRPEALNDSFYDPICSLVKEHPKLAWSALEGIRGFKKKRTLEDWLSAAIPGDAGLHLKFFARAVSELRDIIRKPTLPIDERVRLLMVYAKHLQESGDHERAIVNELATKILLDHDQEIGRELSASNLNVTRAVMKLRTQPVLTDNEKWDEAVTVALKSRPFRRALEELPISEQGKLLQEIEKFRSPAKGTPDQIADEVEDALEIWSALTDVATHDISKALRVLKLLPSEKIAADVITNPESCAKFLRNKQIKSTTAAYKEIISLLAGALTHIDIREIDTERWQVPLGLEGLCWVASIVGRPELVGREFIGQKIAEAVRDHAAAVRLSEILADWNESDPTRQRVAQEVTTNCERLLDEISQMKMRRDPWYLDELTAYLQALVYLRSSFASNVAEYGLRWQSALGAPQDDFTFWWAVSVAIAVRVVAFTAHDNFDSYLSLIAGRWNPDFPASASNIALAGLIAFERGGPAPILSLDETLSAENVRHTDTSLPMRICQLYGIAMSSASPSRDRWCEGTLHAVKGYAFKRQWQELRQIWREYLFSIAQRAQERLADKNLSLRLGGLS